MKAGVVYPQIELGGDTGAVKAFAQAAEDLGYDHIVIYDHVLGAVHAGSSQTQTEASESRPHIASLAGRSCGNTAPS